MLTAMLTPSALTAFSAAATTAPLRSPAEGVSPRLVRDVPPAPPRPAPVSAPGSAPVSGKRGALVDLRV